MSISLLYNKKASMKKILKLTRRAWKIAADNYFISIFITIVAFVGFVSVFKLFTAKGEEVYATVKVSQGLWWANTLNPPLWMIQNLKKGDTEKSLTGSSVAEILEVRYYPAQNQSIQTGQYSTFLTVKLTVDYSNRRGTYTFKRSTISVGSPIDFEFANAQLSGTVISLSNKAPKNQYVYKTVTLYKRFVDSREYEAIQIGDKYFDGEDEVIKIIDKSVLPISQVYIQGRNIGFDDDLFDVEVKVMMKLKQVGNNLMYNDENIIKIGRGINFETSGYYFDGYRILRIE